MRISDGSSDVCSSDLDVQERACIVSIARRSVAVLAVRVSYLITVRCGSAPAGPLSEPVCRWPACAQGGGAPPALPRATAATASCGSYPSPPAPAGQIGRASWRESGGQYVEISVVPG